MQAKSLYIASLEQSSGSLVVSIGIMQFLKSKYKKVAFFRPIINDNDKKDCDINTILKYFLLDMKYSHTYGFYVSEVEDMIARNKKEELYEKLLKMVKRLEKSYDFILIEGVCKNLLTQAIDFDINLEIAKNISAPFVSVLSAKDKGKIQIIEDIKIEADSIKKDGCCHFATFVNRIDEDIIRNCQEYFKDEMLPYELYFLPEKKELDTPTLEQIKNELNCKLVFGHKRFLQKSIGQSKIAAMRVENFIEHIEEKDLIITPGDRSDIVTALLALSHSKSVPNIAAILLTGGLNINKNIKKLLEGFDNLALPILSTSDDTYAAVMKVNDVKSIITPKDQNKIALILGMFSQYVDIGRLEKKMLLSSEEIITPIMFKYYLFSRARDNKKTIVLPESMDDRVLKAAEIAISAGIVDIVLLGDKEDIMHKSSLLGINIEKAAIIDPKSSELIERFANEFCSIRKEKGSYFDGAKDIMMNDHTYFATMMVHLGYADGMVSGAVNTTANTVRPALQIIKTKQNIDVVSSVFFMAFDTKVLVYGDCAINQDPDYKELAQIAISSADTAASFGIEPKIAMLSYSTGDSGSGEDVVKIKKATKLVKQQRNKLKVEGPIQYDAAIDKRIADKKLPNSEVAGNATVFIFPDLNTGNNTYKAVRDSSGAIAIGPILQGLNKPVNDLSRGCEVEDIVNTIAITAIQAGEGS